MSGSTAYESVAKRHSRAATPGSRRLLPSRTSSKDRTMLHPTVLILAFAFAPAAEPKSGGKTLSQWVEELKSPDAKKRIEAADRLEGFREKALPALDSLVAALKDSDPKVRA